MQKWRKSNRVSYAWRQYTAEFTGTAGEHSIKPVRRESRPLQRLALRLFDDRREILRYARDQGRHRARPEGKAIGTSQRELAATLPSRGISRQEDGR
jgi:hypothetical protein